MEPAPPPHPSFFELDLAVAEGREADLAAHTASCADCAAYLARAKERRAMPERIAALERGGGPEIRLLERRRWWWVAALAGAGAVATAAVLVAVPGPGYVGGKGAPGASLYVKRGDAVFQWTPDQPVQAGDLLRLSVVPAGFTQLVVATPAGTRWTPLFQGPVDGQRDFEVPASWRVDAAGTAEQLLIVLSRRPVRAEDLPALALRQPRGEDAWTIHLKIDKISGP